MSASRLGKSDLLAFLLLLLLPAALLGESLFTSDRYLSYDLAEFPPAAQNLTPEQLAAVRSTANYDATEAPIWFAVELQLAREAAERGQLPHWNPYVRNGAPMLAHGHLGLLNPVHMPALWFEDPADGLLYLTYVMFALAGALMFGFLRAMGLGTASAAFGALAFAWSGTLTANGHWFMRMEPLAVLPGMLWGIVGVSSRQGLARAWPAAGLAITTALCWMSGFPQYGIPVTLLAAAFGCMFLVREWRRDGMRSALRLLGWLAGAGLVGMLLAMPQLLQMLLFYPDSNRPIAESLDRATRHAFAPFGFLGYVMPEAFSHPGDSTLPQDASPVPYLWSDLKHWETGEQLLPNYNFTEYAIYPGVVPLALALLALVIRGPRWRWFVVGAFAGVWLLATGAFGLYHAYHLPGIKPVPPYRFAGPACALLAMLAAIGFDGLRDRLRPWSMRGLGIALLGGAVAMFVWSSEPVPDKTTIEDPWLVAIVDRYREIYAEQHSTPEQKLPAAAITPAVALDQKFTPGNRNAPGTRIDAIKNGRERLQWNLRRGGGGLLIVAGLLIASSFRRRENGLRGWPTIVAFGLAAIELGAFGLALNRGQACEHSPDTPVHEFLRERRDAAADAGGFLVGRGVGGVYNLPGGTLAAEHIRDLNFYTFVDNKSDLPIRKLYGDAFILRGFVCDAVPDDDRLRRPYWDLMGLRYVLATRPMEHAGERVGPTTIGDKDYFVYERTTAMPRAWCVGRLEVVNDEAALVDRLADTDLDPRAQVLVDSASANQLATVPANADPGSRTARFVHEDSKRVSIHLQAGDPGYLVIADTFFDGWEAWIDDEPVPMVRGNLYQRVVAVPENECIVEMRFRAPGFFAGFVIGGAAVPLLAVLLLASAWAGIRLRRRHATPTQPPDADSHSA
ncbi:MAG: hypothetical protein NXI31_07920 [bacterium]|nr:hypothetical protein [bacterium]